MTARRRLSSSRLRTKPALTWPSLRPVKAGDLLEILETAGYEPTLDGHVIRLRNCPFDALVDSTDRSFAARTLPLHEESWTGHRAWIEPTTSLGSTPDPATAALSSDPQARPE